jgi:hypothetical protein
MDLGFRNVAIIGNPSIRGINQIWLYLGPRGKSKTFRNPATFWQPVGTYCLNMAILEKKREFFEIFQLFFFPNKNPLYEVHWIFIYLFIYLFVVVTKWREFTKIKALVHST